MIADLAPSNGALPGWTGPAAILIPILTVLGFYLAGPAGAVVAMSVLGILLLIDRPFLLLNLLVVFVGLEDLNTIYDSTFYALTAVKLVGYLLTVAIGFDIIRNNRLKLDSPTWVLGALLVVLTASIAVAQELDRAMSEWLRLAQLAVLFFATRQLVRNEERLRTLSMTALVVMSISATAGVISYVTGSAGEDRIQGISQNAAILAADLTVALGLGMALFRTEPDRRLRRFWFVLLLLVSAAIIMSQTRAAIISIGVTTVFMIMTGRFARVKMVAISLAVLIGYLTLFSPAQKMVHNTVYLGDNSTRQHLLTLKAGLEMTQDFPLLGVGLGNYPVHYLDYTNDLRGMPKSAHNTYLAFASESGIVSAILFVLLIFACFLKAWGERRKFVLERDSTGMALACGIVFSVFALSIFSVFHSLRAAKFFWVVVAIAASSPAIFALRRQEQQQ